MTDLNPDQKERVKRLMEMVEADERENDQVLERPCTEKEVHRVIKVLRLRARKSLIPPWVSHTDLLRHSHLEALVFRAAIRELRALGLIVMQREGPRKLYRYQPDYEHDKFTGGPLPKSKVVPTYP